MLNRIHLRHLVPVVVLLALSAAAVSLAEGDSTEHVGPHLEVNNVDRASRDQGLQAWDRIYDVVSHPRCANCHTDEQNLPMWSPSGEGGARIHGMNISAGDSRQGRETLPCGTCHMTSTAPNTVPHAPPHAGLDWQLAPLEFEWFGIDSPSICRQMRDPRRNGGRDGRGLIEHITHDAAVGGFITWGFDPGGGREAAPGTLQEHLDDTVLWVAAGMPCPEPEE